VSKDGNSYSSNWCRGGYCSHTAPDIKKFYEKCKNKTQSDECYLFKINENNWDFDSYKEFKGYILRDFSALTPKDIALINKIKSANDLKVTEGQERQALAKKAAEEKKRQALAKKAAEEKKRRELPKRAEEQEQELLKTRKKPAKW